jgi:uncharacterized membrane protein
MHERNDAPNNAGRERKKAQFTSPAAGNRKTGWILIALAAIAGIGYFALGRTSERPATAEIMTVAAAESQDPAEDMVVVPIAGLAEGKATFFDYVAGDKTRVRFFVVKGSDGVYRAALDACDVCYTAKKGYSQDGDDMICKQCRQRFPISRVNEEAGGCNPVPLERKVAGGNLLIPKSELESRTSYF